MAEDATRRKFLGDTARMGAALGAMHAADAAAGERPADGMPTIQLGKLRVSRLILGSNPFFGFAHGNPQASADQMKQYYTDERVMAVLDAAADQGIDAVWTPCYDRWIRLWNAYREKGGKLKHWIGQPDRFDQMKQHITACARNGGSAMAIQGACIDRAFRSRQHDLVREWLDLIHSFELPAGMATHSPQNHLEAEETKLPTDFYHQCLYQPDNYSRTCWEQAVATIRKLDKPVVVYKVLAAGRIAPAKAFTELFAKLRPKDGLCVGVFPKQRDEIAEDVALTRTLTAQHRPA